MKHQQQQNILQSLELGVGVVAMSKQRSQLLSAKAKLHKRKKNDLSTTWVAFMLLRFNVALQIAVLAMLVNLGLGIGTFFYGTNALYCAFGIDCIIGVITAAILIWRFASQKKEYMKDQPNVYLLNSGNAYSRPNMIAVNKYDHLLDSLTIDPDDVRDHARELWSTFWLGQVMIISGVVVIIRTVIEIATHLVAAYAAGREAEERLLDLDRVLDYGFEEIDPLDGSSMEPLFVLALISLCLNLLLMSLKIVIYYFLDSNSMLIEGINSLISAIFALVAMISIRYSESVQYLDQIVSILFGVFLIVYGGYNMLHTIGETVYEVVKKNKHNEYQQLV